MKEKIMKEETCELSPAYAERLVLTDLLSETLDVWSDINPVGAYTSGWMPILTTLFKPTVDNVEAIRWRIHGLQSRLDRTAQGNLRTAIDDLLKSLSAQLDSPTPSGAGPAGTAVGGVWAAADGLFAVVLKGDHRASFVRSYLDAVLDTLAFETLRWQGRDFNALLREECLGAASYLQMTLTSLVQMRPDLDKKCKAILATLSDYKRLFIVDGAADPAGLASMYPSFNNEKAAPVMRRRSAIRRFWAPAPNARRPARRSRSLPRPGSIAP